ncbi:hypothetical protein G5B38_09865 [Pseudohalocynthiibacter aestuariivivens]|nr:hypothetical protein [Pseudohalocynthiibacter aestuariivivens]QIE45806.1 hypothetical protein G5B38_09865 [Pseudohalocynthiibacter aestuariivivens]
MTTAQTKRGGAPVGLLAELGGIEAASVIYLRLWCAKADGRIDIENDFVAMLGAAQGERAANAFTQLCSMCTQYGRRPLVRHAMTCKCLGADEACFANLIATAADGAHDDAALIATLMIRPAMADEMAALAHNVGIAFRRMRLCPSEKLTAPTRHDHATLH